MDIKRVLESNCELYNISFEENINFQFRLLKIKEFNLFNKLLNGGTAIPPFLIYEEIFNICFLGNVEFLDRNTPMGYILSTGELIYDLSGGNSGESFLFQIAKERKENPLDSLYEHMRCTIFTVFQKLCIKDVDEMTEKEFIRYFVSAENVLSKTKPGFERMDLMKIHEELFGEKKEEKPENKERDFSHLIQSGENEVGHWEKQEAEERFIKEQMSQLNKEQLRALDRR